MTKNRLCWAGMMLGFAGYRLFQDRYWVARISGSTGSPGVFLWNRAEWTTVIASYARAQEWAGITADLVRRTRIGVVSSRIPWHQSALVGMSDMSCVRN